MDKSQRKAGRRRGPGEGRGLLRRLHDLLEEGLASPRLIPVPIPMGPEAAYRPGPSLPAEPQVHRVFGRRRDEDRDRDEAAGEGDSTEQSGQAVEPASDLGGDEFEPPRSDLTGQDGSDQAAAEESPLESPAAADPGEAPASVDPWSRPAMADPFAFQPGSDAPELPAWTPSPLQGGGFPSFEPPPSPEEQGPSPWAGDFGVTQEPPSPTDAFGAGTQGGGWPPSPSESGGQLWSAGGAEEEAASAESPLEEASAASVSADDGQGEYSPSELDQAGGEEVAMEAAAETTQELQQSGDEEAAMEAAAETTQEGPGDLQPFEPDQLPEVVAVSDTAWTVSSVGGGYQLPREPVGPEPGSALVEGARSFPLPEGELLFKNLSVGFTDPARLLRHLAGEGHTGVMHVASPDGRNTYIVLVEGYVVAVASDSQGRLSTTSRVSFPAFPNSEDIITVISYSAEIARGLGLLLHAPVHFSGLGAMFVDLDGLRNFLGKRSASGGLVVESTNGTGVALFDEGRLVGAYSGAAVPDEDLAPLRELITDLDAEIDVRFGGPHSLEPIPLETLLAGYPL